ncbi:MAG: hypothetical protein H3C47_05070 [Candidatus Cloacimonetes bacterium]|nr:hypothetical protein [Candidatus Cloacimonadota bacterium]
MFTLTGFWTPFSSLSQYLKTSPRTVIEYRKQEGLLIELTQEADFTKFYLELGYSSLFEYLNLGQGISAATVGNLITVA